MTYPNEKVARELNDRFVPCKVESAKHPELAKRLAVRWLPGLAVIDSTDERPASIAIGFLPPEDLLAELTFGRAIAAMAQKRYDDAHALFREIAENPTADRAPEAYYWWGVSKYRQTKDLQASLLELWPNILEKWPKSPWARKVAFMRRFAKDTSTTSKVEVTRPPSS